MEVEIEHRGGVPFMTDLISRAREQYPGLDATRLYALDDNGRPAAAIEGLLETLRSNNARLTPDLAAALSRFAGHLGADAERLRRAIEDAAR